MIINFVVANYYEYNSLASSPYNSSSIAGMDDLDALIMIDVQLIDSDSEDSLETFNHQIANIQFNNLDIIGGYFFK